MTSRPIFLLALSGAALLGGCKKDETTPPPFQAAPKVAPPPQPAGPPAFTPPDSGSTQAPPEPPKAAAPAPVPAAPAKTPAPAAKPATPPKPAASPKSVKPAPAASSSAVAPSAQGAWVLQVGIHKTSQAAEAAAAKLKAKGFPAYVLNVATGGTGLAGSYYRVRIGAFASREEALQYGESVLKPAGVKDYWADKKSNEARAQDAQVPSP